MLEAGEGTFIDGTYVHRFGSGPRRFLAIHGWGGSHETFEPVAEHAPDDVTLYAIDMPGYGRSEPPTEWTPACLQDRLVAVVDAVGEDLTLIGNCSGAVFGLLAALKRDGAFRNLVLIDPFAYFPWYFRIFTWPLLGRFFYTFTFQNPLGRFATNLGLASKRAAETNLTSSFDAINHEAVFQSLQVMRMIGGYRAFRDITRPTSLVIGARTFGAVKRSVSLWQSLWPSLAVHELAEAGHLPLQEATESFARIAFESNHHSRNSNE